MFDPTICPDGEGSREVWGFDLEAISLPNLEVLAVANGFGYGWLSV
jgi:hypothetical protein